MNCKHITQGLCIFFALLFMSSSASAFRFTMHDQRLAAKYLDQRHIMRAYFLADRVVIQSVYGYAMKKYLGQDYIFRYTTIYNNGHGVNFGDKFFATFCGIKYKKDGKNEVTHSNGKVITHSIEPTYNSYYGKWFVSVKSAVVGKYVNIGTVYQTTIKGAAFRRIFEKFCPNYKGAYAGQPKPLAPIPGLSQEAPPQKQACPDNSKTVNLLNSSLLKIQSLQKELATLQSSNAHLRQSISSLTSKLNESSVAKQKLEAELTSTKTKLAEVQKSSNEKITALEASLKEKESALAAAKAGEKKSVEKLARCRRYSRQKTVWLRGWKLYGKNMKKRVYYHLNRYNRLYSFLHRYSSKSVGSMIREYATKEARYKVHLEIRKRLEVVKTYKENRKALLTCLSKK